MSTVPESGESTQGSVTQTIEAYRVDRRALVNHLNALFGNGTFEIEACLAYESAVVMYLPLLVTKRQLDFACSTTPNSR